MAKNKQKVLTSKPFFSSYTISCYLKKESEDQPMVIDLSPFATLIAANVEYSATRTSIEKCLANALLNVFASIEDQFVILKVTHQ